MNSEDSGAAVNSSAERSAEKPLGRLPRGPVSRDAALTLIGAVSLIGIVAIWLSGATPQDAAYHDFADKRPLLGVPNFADVVSNFGLLIVGVIGLVFVARGGRGAETFRDPRERAAWAWMFAGLALTAFGSGYYHLDPTNETLFWDRLPMTLTFMPFFAAVIGERVDARLGRWVLWPLLAVGIASVIHWHIGEAAGRGDLRLYAMVQFVPMLAAPLMLLLLPASYTGGRDLFFGIAWYGFAKVYEATDEVIFTAIEVVSGHTLKHLAAAAAPAWFLLYLRRRRPVEPD